MRTQPLIVQFGYTQLVIRLNTEGISDAEALVRPESCGNSLNWVVGHITAARQGLLQALGQERVWDEAKSELYGRGGAPLADADAVPLSEILEVFNACQERIGTGLETIDDARLDEPAQFSPVNNEAETVESLLAGLAFHESYHVGQTGVIRRLLGKPGAIA